MGKGFWLTVCPANHPLFSLSQTPPSPDSTERLPPHLSSGVACSLPVSVGPLELTPEQVSWEAVCAFTQPLCLFLTSRNQVIWEQRGKVGFRKLCPSIHSPPGGLQPQSMQVPHCGKGRRPREAMLGAGP